MSFVFSQILIFSIICLVKMLKFKKISISISTSILFCYCLFRFYYLLLPATHYSTSLIYSYLLLLFNLLQSFYNNSNLFLTFYFTFYLLNSSLYLRSPFSLWNLLKQFFFIFRILLNFHILLIFHLFFIHFFILLNLL